MTGEEFIALAGALATTPGLGGAEARFRTAASRAYYGAYHLAAKLLLDCGAPVRANANGHQEVLRGLRHAAVTELHEAAVMLGDLQTQRIRADYRLNDARVANSAKAMHCFELAYDVKRRLDACRGNPDTMKAIEQSFAE